MFTDFPADALNQLDPPRRMGDVTLIATAELPSRFGEFKIAVFHEESTGKEHSAVYRGELKGGTDIPCRVHSECHTGDIFGSLRCDCRSQLEKALSYVGSQPRGVVLYMRQEGRGIGLGNKVKAYRLQEIGLDTVEANVALGFPPEARDYKSAANMLRLLGITSIKLLSNNPHKFNGLAREGIEITGRIPIIIEPNQHNRRYLKTKALKMGHDLNGTFKSLNFKSVRENS